MACILTYLLLLPPGSIVKCRLLFPFLHSIKDSVGPSKVCLYGCINWSVAQACHQSSLRLSQSSTFVKRARAKPKDGFHFNVQKWPVPESGGPTWPTGFTLILSLMLKGVAGNQQEVLLPVPQTLGRKGSMEDVIPDVSKSLTSSPSSSSCV